MKINLDTKTKKISFCAIMASLAIVLSTLEHFVPIDLLIPIPGIKIGFANIVTLICIYYVGYKETLSVIFIRCAIVNLLFKTFVSFVFSISGAVLAFLVMILLKRYIKFFSLTGISIAGAASFNIGQIAACAILLKNVYIFNYLPFLLWASIPCGIIVAVVTMPFLNKN